MELWDAYDDQRHIIKGVKLVRDEPVPRGMNHLVVHAWYINSRHELLIQQRAFDRPLGPGLWFCTGGSALAGEDTVAACIRETQEEMGFTPDMSQALLPISMKGPEYFTDVYMIPTDVQVQDLTLQTSEVAAAKWASVDEIAAMAREGTFWRVRYLDMLLQFVREQYMFATET